MMTDSRGRRFPGMGLRLKIAARVQEVCHLVDGYSQYDPGFNDYVLARLLSKEWGVEITGPNVRTCRHQVVGKKKPHEPKPKELPLPEPEPSVQDVDVRIDKLTTAIDNLARASISHSEAQVKINAEIGRVTAENATLTARLDSMRQVVAQLMAWAMKREKDPFRRPEPTLLRSVP